MKRLKPTIWLFLLGQLLLPGKIMAQDAIKVVEPDDHEIVYILATRPTVTFEGNTVHLVSERLEVIYELYDIHNLQFFDTKNNEEANVSIIGENPTLYNITPESLEISNIPSSTPVSIYDAQGRLIQHTISDYKGSTSISISSLPQAIYVVKAGSTTFKFHKK